MISASYVLATRNRLDREMRASAFDGEYADEAAFQRAVDSAVEDAIQEDQQSAAHERETFGGPEETPCIQSADTWGTGEGRYHGLI